MFKNINPKQMNISSNIMLMNSKHMNLNQNPMLLNPAL